MSKKVSVALEVPLSVYGNNKMNIGQFPFSFTLSIFGIHHRFCRGTTTSLCVSFAQGRYNPLEE